MSRTVQSGCPDYPELNLVFAWIACFAVASESSKLYIDNIEMLA
jgi:hypothetical protein